MQTTWNRSALDDAQLRRAVRYLVLGMLLLASLTVGGVLGAPVDGPSAKAGSQQLIHFLEWNTIRLPSDTADVPPSAPANPVERGWDTKF